MNDLRRALSEGEEVLCVHYACEDFAQAKDRPAAVSCIAVTNLKDDQCIAFSQGDAASDAAESVPEVQLLEGFFDYLSKHREARIVHWNMNSSSYGFHALALRYKYLTKNEPSYSPQQRLIYDLDAIIADMFGDVYVGHPKLQNVATLNALGMRSFLPGAEEAKLFTTNDFGTISRSVSTKSRLIGGLLKLLISGRLQTQTSVGSVAFAGGVLDAVALVHAIGDRFLYVKRSLLKRHAGRATIEIKDEYDAQDLFRSLLVMFFDDVRPETVTPSYAGSSTRIDFVLPAFKLAIELKQARASMSTKDLAEQLVIDRNWYKEHPGVAHLICLVFDYDGLLNNPRAVESDLSRESSVDDLVVNVRIYDR